MAISTLDQLIAGFQPPLYYEKTVVPEAAGVLASTFFMPGIPGPAVAPTSAIAGDALTSYPGQLPFANPSSGDAYLACLSGHCTQPGTVVIADRLWHNASISPTTTGAQTVTSATWPARDANGATDGDGVLVAIEVSTATTNAGSVTNTTMSYTNSAGTSGRTGTIASFPATALQGVFVPFRLQAGDTGVRSIQSLTLGTSYGPSGSPIIHLVAYRLLAVLGIPLAAVGDVADAFRLGMPKMFDDSVPFLLFNPGNTTNNTLRGRVVYAHG
jgi:hypothetical protein